MRLQLSNEISSSFPSIQYVTTVSSCSHHSYFLGASNVELLAVQFQTVHQTCFINAAYATSNIQRQPMTNSAGVLRLVCRAQTPTNKRSDILLDRIGDTIFREQNSSSLLLQTHPWYHGIRNGGEIIKECL